MAFSTFNISELPNDADDDFVIEITTRSSKLGVTLSRDEMEAMAHAMAEAAGGEFEDWDGHQVPKSE